VVGGSLSAGSTTLQWGRRLSAAERSITRSIADSADPLQWGRRLSAAESPLCTVMLSRCDSLQWGRRLSAAERPTEERRGHRLTRASMGPPPFSGGEP